MSLTGGQPGDRSTDFQAGLKGPSPHPPCFKMPSSDLPLATPFPTGQKAHGTQGICPPGAWDPLLDLASSTQDHRMFCSNDQSLLPGPTRAPSLSHSSEGLLCFQVTHLWAPGAAETADGGGSEVGAYYHINPKAHPGPKAHARAPPQWPSLAPCPSGGAQVSPRWRLQLADPREATAANQGLTHWLTWAVTQQTCLPAYSLS